MDSDKTQHTCKNCGAELAATADTCIECGSVTEAADKHATQWSEWARERDGRKLRWVVSVVAFWISGAVFLAIFLARDRVDPILASISLGLLLAGVWLKASYQLHLRKEPGRPSVRD